LTAQLGCWPLKFIPAPVRNPILSLGNDLHFSCHVKKELACCAGRQRFRAQFGLARNYQKPFLEWPGLFKASSRLKWLLSLPDSRLCFHR
jgi:hypothetical protein